MPEEVAFKLCVFCKTDKPITSFQKTRGGSRVNKCNQCKYLDTKKNPEPRYVSLKERVKLNIERI
jgi:hypothetical protein